MGRLDARRVGDQTGSMGRFVDTDTGLTHCGKKTQTHIDTDTHCRLLKHSQAYSGFKMWRCDDLWPFRRVWSRIMEPVWIIKKKGESLFHGAPLLFLFVVIRCLVTRSAFRIWHNQLQNEPRGSASALIRLVCPCLFILPFIQLPAPLLPTPTSPSIEVGSSEDSRWHGISGGRCARLSIWDFEISHRRRGARAHEEASPSDWHMHEMSLGPLLVHE